MGSFSEVVMALVLRDDTPADVLAAFSRLANPPVSTDGAATTSRPAPELPEPHSAWYDDSVLWEEPDESYRPWLYDWSSYLSTGHDTVYIESAKYATLAWTRSGWLLSFRTTIKGYPDDLTRGFAWLGAYAAEGEEDRPFLVGYMKHEGEKRPWLVWTRGAGPFDFENLNVPTDHGLTEADASLLRAHMWRRTKGGNRLVLEGKLREAESGTLTADKLANELDEYQAMPDEPPDDWNVPLASLINYRDRLWKELVNGTYRYP